MRDYKIYFEMGKATYDLRYYRLYVKIGPNSISKLFIKVYQGNGPITLRYSIKSGQIETMI